VLPPGFAKLLTNPSPMGSAAIAATIGIVLVAFFAAITAGLVGATIKATSRLTRSSAN